MRRTLIPKANGKMRPLDIPTILDRVVQAGTLLIFEPIFEEDFEDCSYGFRPTGPKICFKPIPEMVELNEHLGSWSNYFGEGHPRKAFREINHYVRQSLYYHL